MVDSQYWCYFQRVIWSVSYIVGLTPHNYRTVELRLPGCASWVRLKLCLAWRSRQRVNSCVPYGGPLLMTHIRGLTGSFARDGQLHGRVSGMFFSRE